MAIRSLLITISILAISACGFQLKGSYTLPEQYQQIQLQVSDPYSAITRDVTKRLKDGGVEIVSSQGESHPTLVLGKDTLERSNLSLYPDGQVAEYRLTYSLEASVLEANKPARQLSLQVQRDYLDDPRQALAKKREMEVLLSEMRQQISDQLMVQLASQ
ncbi:LPS assembly lipoprotein LptE [Echinimonas agarilytica]|uniref:LPS-assembly lipoprotein LptE n=1 Tax=Echinimonas agarilytica TaxID=1215918 RepID=A0AA42B7C5_9GAMM|nr:LPS assembly lipoprotein LptE [Echinimonas agarilytica]MCM2679088.1 LPS assembly lipoprotein LptE [Echinimonas agarilytica]